MGAPYSARNCRVALKNAGGQVYTLLASRVTVHTNADRIDVTNFESGTDVNGVLYGTYLAGVVSATLSIETYDSSIADSNDHWSAGFQAGMNSGQILIYLTNPRDSTRAWWFPKITVNDVSSDNEVHGAVKSMISVMNQGRFMYPGEAKAAVTVNGEVIPWVIFGN